MQSHKVNEKRENNIIQTLRLVEARGYNLTIESLSHSLIGGSIDKTDLYKIIRTMNEIEFDGIFVATKGNLFQNKCRLRRKINTDLQPWYRQIGKEFTNEFIHLCPWIICVCYSGSLASNGLSYEDDVDLNIVVADGTKYTTWILGILLSMKYSWRYRKQFNVHWYNVITKVVCISVIWEHSQIMPFRRQDSQLAYELYLNQDVIYNKKYYYEILLNNEWIFFWFPQLKQILKKQHKKSKKINDAINKRWIPRLIERCNYYLVIFLFYWIRAVIFWHQPLLDRMDHVNKVKHPYAMKDPI